MRLKKLHIKGFKSFADETVVHFDNPIIGIVGPNGSGKSNLVDSIRWVLGEQRSKDLRLDKMTDVIFNGSKKRKAGNLAQVTLTFENTKNIIPIEFDEVAITRILYSDGESEYRINDVKCRLRDIRDLFLDSGIGSNSYAIIELKMVDDILLDRDRARLKMFEQAAGISKYKARKHETLGKLKNTEVDLNRIEDLLYELQNSLNELKRQASRTKKHNELKDKYRSHSVSLAYYEIKSSHEKLSHLKEKIQEALVQYETDSAAKRNIEAQVEQIKKQNLDNEKTLSESQESFNMLIDHTRRLESRKEIVEQKIEFNTRTVSQNNERIHNIQNELEGIQSEVNKLSETIVSAKEEYEMAMSQSQGISQKYNQVKQKRDEAREFMSNSQDRHLNDQKEVFDLEKNIALLQNEIGTNVSNLDNYKTQLEKIQNASKFDRDEKEKLLAQIAIKQGSLDQIDTKIKNNEEIKTRLQGDKDLLAKEIQGINRNFDSKKNELDLLLDMIENMEGFPESVKFVSNFWKKKIPILQDVINVKEQYKVAIEQYLEPYLNYFIADNRNDAFQSIQLLRDSQKGKSQFFVLDSIPSSENNNKKVENCIPAVDVLQYETKYAGLIRELFKNVFITEPGVDFHTINTDSDSIIIANNGSIIKSKISIKGGSIGIFEGKKIGRIQNVEKLKKQIEGLSKQRTQFEKDFLAINQSIDRIDLYSLESEKLKITDEINNLQISLAQKETLIQSFETQITSLNERFNIHLSAKSSKEKELESVIGTLFSLKNNLEKRKDVEHTSNETFGYINKEFDETSQIFNEHQIRIIKAQAKFETINSEKDIKSQQQNIQQKRLNDYKESNLRLERETEQLKIQIEEICKELENSYSNKSNAQKDLSERERLYFAEKSKVIEEEDKIKKLDRVLTDIQIKVNEKKSDLQNLEFTNQTINERLNIEFNLKIEDVNPEELIDFSESDLMEERIRVDRLRARLENFGEINPMALSAYEEMLKRHNSTGEQRDDIIKAKESLLETISEIEETATTQFHEAFVLIRDNFRKVFRELFTEDDDCDLVLLNPDSPLESEIEIVAKPKGKRPKVLKQLSAGEKTLTATALLFSLYLLKPAPFCIFDEVDAPLDDINVSKFTKLIKKFSKESQFIIITHNKSTMTSVDVLYGIFLKEEGVSGLAPVDFRQLEYI